MIYDITCIPVRDELCDDDHAHKPQDAVVRLLRKSPEGRLDVAPCAIGLVAELEGQTEDYGKDEIEENLVACTLPEADWQGNHYRLSTRVLDAIERAGVRHFRAHPLTLTHAATKRAWNDYWMVQFICLVSLKSGDDRELLFVDADTNSGLYCNAAFKQALAPLKVFKFDKVV